MSTQVLEKDDDTNHLAWSQVAHDCPYYVFLDRGVLANKAGVERMLPGQTGRTSRDLSLACQRLCEHKGASIFVVMSDEGVAVFRPQTKPVRVMPTNGVKRSSLSLEAYKYAIERVSQRVGSGGCPSSDHIVSSLRKVLEELGQIHP